MFSVLRALGQSIRDTMAEYDYAQRRAVLLRANPDNYVFQPGQAPDTYDEFLFRTSGPLPHEPSAAQRSSGRLVR